MSNRLVLMASLVVGGLGLLSTPIQAGDYAKPAVDPKGEWAPVRVGEEALYRLVSKREAVSGPSVRVSEVLEGTQHMAVRRVPGSPIEVAWTATLHQRGKADEVERESQFLELVDGAYHVTGLRTAITGSAKDVQLEKPVLLFPNEIAKGTKWESARFEFDGIRYREEAEVLGVQDAQTPAGLFKKCLVVRHKGKLEGEFERDGVRVRVKRGEIERTQWLARGVGTVMFKEEFSSTFVVPTGQGVRTRVTQQAALKGTRQLPLAAH